MKQNYEPIHFVDTSCLLREEWLEYRKHGIGASDIPVIFEKSEYKSVLGLFLEKVSRRPKEELDNMVEQRIRENKSVEIGPALQLFGALRQPIIDPGTDFNLTTAYGHALEPVIGEYLSCRLGVPVYRVPVMLQHPHYPFLFADLDFVAVFPDPETGELCNAVNVQCKTATHWKLDDIKERMPYSHELQCRQEMAVANLDETIIIYLCDNNEGGVISYRIARDYGMESSIIQKAKAFWTGNVEKEILPIPSVPTDAAERDIAEYALSRRQYRKPPEILERGMPELVHQYAALKALADEKKHAYEDAKADLAGIELQLSPYMLGRAEASCGDVKMRWKQTTSRPADLDGLKLAYPEIYARFVSEKVNSGFEVKLKKSAQNNENKEAA